MVEGMPFSYFFHPVRQNVGVMPGPGQPSWATNWKPQMKGGHITWWKEPGSLMLTVILPTLNSQLLCKREKETSNLLKPWRCCLFFCFIACRQTNHRNVRGSSSFSQNLLFLSPGLSVVPSGHCTHPFLSLFPSAMPISTFTINPLSRPTSGVFSVKPFLILQSLESPTP